jgi:hypothetical protein
MKPSGELMFRFLGSGGNHSVLRFEGFLGLGNDGGEGCGIGFDTGGFQAFDEARIGHVLVAAGSVDTLGPKRRN